MNFPILGGGGRPVARLAPMPASGSDGGYPWVDGELLYAADLNAAIADTVPVVNPITDAPGIVAFPSTDPLQSPDSYALTGSMTFRGQPYGYYDTGALLSLVATTWPLSQSRAGINGGFEAGVSAIAAYGTFDSVNIYNSVLQTPPPLVLHSVTYTATQVIPQTPLTTAQMQALRVNMWVLTNSIDTTINMTPSMPNGALRENHYGSYVTGWASDGSSISVVGWTVPGSGHTALGQVPPVGTLDPGTAANATAYFGSPTNVFGANFVFTNHPGVAQDSRSKYFQGIEFDFINYGTVPYQMYVAGISMDYNPVNGAAASADSYGIKLAGFPTGQYITFANVGLNIAANELVLLSNAFNIYVWASPPPWSGSAAANLTWESMDYIDSNLFRLQCWVSRDTGAGSGGWPDGSLHLGVRIDGTPQTMTGGTPLAQLVWSPQGFQGGLQLQSGGGVAALSVDSSAWVYPRVVNAANDAAAATAGVPVGAMYRNGSVLQIRVT